MLNSIKLIPPDELFLFKDYKNFPYDFLPNIVFIYKNNVIQYDSKDILLLYSLNNNINNFKEDLIKNKFINLDFKNVVNPLRILVKNKNLNDIINKRFKEIKNLLPFCDGISNIILKFLPSGNLFWKIDKKRKWGWSSYNLMMNNYTVTSESDIPFYIPRSKIYNNQKYYLHKIIYGIYEKNSNIPEIIIVNKKHIPVYHDKITKIIYLMKKPITYIEENLLE